MKIIKEQFRYFCKFSEVIFGCLISARDDRGKCILRLATGGVFLQFKGIDREASIKVLTYYANGLNAQAFAHKVQGKVFAAQGFEKLGEKYAEHAVEEAGWVDKMLDRILDLGGSLTIEATKAVPVCDDVEAYLQSEKKVSEEGIEMLRRDIQKLSDDLTTADLLKAYLKDEEEDLNWTALQSELIAKIGLQNWLARQM